MHPSVPHRTTGGKNLGPGNIFPDGTVYIHNVIPRTMKTATTLLLICALGTAAAQEGMTAAQYDAIKAALVPPGAMGHPSPPTLRGTNRDADSCGCWVAPDTSWTTIDLGTQWNASGFNNGDDGSHGPIDLPFTFQIYGASYTQVYININGNISFGNQLGTYTSSPFPMEGPTLIAPFWADVDLRATGPGINTVQYKLTPTALLVSWKNVGYYNQQTDKLNSFQLIISDGGDPVIPGGNNVAFCYGSMEWTTGSASGGISGFGGTAATVGANKGDFMQYLQVGRFDHAGDDWGGPFATPGGVGWLTGRHFSFSTATEAIAPIFVGINCDTMEVEVGTSYDYPMMVVAGGNGQVITAGAECPGIAAFQPVVTNVTGGAKINATFTPAASELGLHTIVFTAHNDAPVPLNSAYTAYVRVVPASTVGLAGLADATTFSLQPNPAGDQVQLTWPAAQRPQHVQVFATDGTLVMEQAVGASATQMQLNLQHLPAGLYTIRAIGTNNTVAKRLMHIAAQ